MKIYPDPGIKQLQNVQRKQPASPAEKSKGTGKADRVDFSKQLKEMQLQGTSSVNNDLSVDAERQARIEGIKNQIAGDSYQPDRNKVAESLLKYIVEGK